MPTRLPGLSFDTVAAPTLPGLPRMDVALFAGFAARGPCHRPLSVESPQAFADTFGGDLSLAWDGARGITLTAQLPAAVASFFAHGGSRCQVIRLARTAALAARWSASSPDPDCAEAALFPIRGALARLPGPAGISLGPARLAAASVGSWADSMTLAVRGESLPLTLGAVTPLAHGLRFPDRDGVGIGDLLEIADADGAIRRFARVVRRVDGEALAVWAGAFAAVVEGPTQTLALAGGNGEFRPGNPALLIAEPPLAVDPGGWLVLPSGAGPIWLRVDHQDGRRFSGPAWRQVPAGLPVGPYTARRLQLAVLARLGASSAVTTGLGSGILEPLSVATLADDDAFYAEPSHTAAQQRPAFAAPATDREALGAALAAAGGLAAISARFGTAAGTAAEAELLGAGWLPLGLGSGFGPGDPPLPPTRPALARDGLSRHDAEISLDPQLADLASDAVLPRAQALRDLEGDTLLGVHALLNNPTDPYDAPSLLALPDAAQPSWERRLSSGPIAPPRPGATVPPRWRDHLGGCGGDADTPLLAPDTRRFLDSDTRLIAAPQLSGPTLVNGESFRLSWNAGAPGTIFVLEESPRADFAAVAEIWRGNATSHPIAGRPEGIFYYRLRAELDGNVSAYAALGVTVQRSAYVVTGPDSTRLARLHLALLRLAAGDLAPTAALAHGLAQLRAGEEP